MRILVLSFYYPPDLAAGSFRTKALTEQLSEHCPEVELQAIAAMPNRYQSFRAETPREERDGNVSVRLIPVPSHSSGLADQMLASTVFAARVLPMLIGQRFDVMYATASRLMTAFLGMVAAQVFRGRLYLDIRDLFVDTIGNLFTGLRAAVAVPVFKVIESLTFRRADRINVVSAGFVDARSGRLLDDLEVDCSQTRTVLDWEPPVDVEEGMAQTFATDASRD